MKKSLKHLFLISLMTLMSLIHPAFAVEDWNSVYESYDEAEYEKIISQEEYKDAINAFKKFQNRDEKPKKSKKKEQDLEKKPTKKKLIFESPSSPEPLLTLPILVSHNGKLIPQGFYLAKAINQNNQYFIRLTQGEGRIVADIEANVFKTDNLKKIPKSQEKVFSEIIEDDMLKITYSNQELILEAYLWIQ